MNRMRILGTLEPFAETGTEGVIWAIHAAGLPGYEGLFVLEKGDGLRIYGAGGDIAWEGTVALEYQRRYRPYPLNPQYGQQEIQGFWVHGFQSTLEPEAWATPFFEGAPAVAWVKAAARPPGIIEHLEALATNPAHHGEKLAEAYGKDRPRLEQSLIYAQRHFHAQMDWLPPPDDFDLAHALLEALAIDQAQRALWQPGWHWAGHWPHLRALWPTCPDEATLRQWAAFRFPADEHPLLEENA